MVFRIPFLIFFFLFFFFNETNNWQENSNLPPSHPAMLPSMKAGAQSIGSAGELVSKQEQQGEASRVTA